MFSMRNVLDNEVYAMYRNIIGLLMILLSSSINFSGQLFFLKVSRSMPSPDTGQDIKLAVYFRTMEKLLPVSRHFILGAALLFTGLTIWVFALRFIRFSIGFPIYLSFSISFSVLYATLVSKESMGIIQYLGLALLILGVILLARK